MFRLRLNDGRFRYSHPPPESKSYKLDGRGVVRRERGRRHGARLKPKPKVGSAASVETSGRDDAFPVVAVGASAGGLEAFTSLLKALPSSTGMAFVFIQHLDPTHQSILSELLAKSAKMPVAEARDGANVLPDHVYVIPPNVNMGIASRRLKLTPRTGTPGHYAPIDFFMKSLAEARNSRSIGVVLSGTASDGTHGLAAIKAEGGITFAQDEKSAKYNGMPHSAIASGYVDFILPPDKIAKELVRISRHPYLTDAAHEVERSDAKRHERSSEGLDKIYVLLRKSCGINFRGYKPGTIERRTNRRMALHRLDHVNEYARYIEKHPAEAEALCRDLLIPVTSFFRDAEALESLKSKVFSAIVKDKTNNATIRIWVPGCSTGEEVYSLAIILLEFLGDRASSYLIQMFGTDVNEKAIEKARAGNYPERISHEVSAERLRRFFTKGGDGYRVGKSIRDLCIFAKQDLAEDPPFSQMNLVSCRNVLIYLGQALQSKVIPILHYALRPSGFLALGNAESVATFTNLFDPVDKKHRIFRKKAVVVRLHHDFSANRYSRQPADALIAAQEVGFTGLEQQQEADRVVLTKYSPPGVVINEDMEILQFRGQLGSYVEPASGRASLNLMKIARRELAAELRSAVNQIKRTHSPVKRNGIEFRRHGQLRSVNISVEPLRPSRNHFLVLFEPALTPVFAKRTASGKVRGVRGAAKAEIAELRRKLTVADEHLRTMIESKEASDEEYQSANEEILSANEELQSTNEELETSKEELQSTNEELNTVNDELHNRNLELDRANNDLNNVLASTTLPVVMVDRGLRIRRMTAASSKVLKTLPSDVGRPITEIHFDIAVPDLETLIGGVIETLAAKELEVQDRRGCWYLLQVRPYRTTDDKIDGAVLVLSDIDAMKRLNERLQKSKEFTEDILDTVREPLAVLNPDLKVLYVNPSFLKNFKVKREDTEGKKLYELGNEQWNIPQLRGAMEEVISKNLPLLDFEVTHDFQRLGTKTMLLNARRIEDGHSADPMMLLAIEDITERKRVEQALQQAHDQMESLVELRTAAVRKLSVDLIHSQDYERRRISRELHDSVGQYLSNAKMNVENLTKRMGARDEVRDLSQVAETLDKCMSETRTISHLLHPPMLEDVGFRSAAQWYLEGFSERSGIRVNQKLPTEKKRLMHGEIELVLFRVLQESLTNVHRHSGSSSVDVQLTIDPDMVTLEIKDYGSGIPREKLEAFRESGQGVGIGLSSMRERSTELGGKFEIESGNGTLIRVALPLSKPQNLSS